MPVLEAQVARWLAEDPDPQTRETLTLLRDQAAAGDTAAAAELADAFAGRLQFGTAGLRGALGPGPNRMNRVVVSQAAAGLAQYLNDSGLGAGRVVIGYDARHNSAVFAADSAEIFAAAGFETLLTDGPLPTPVIAFGIGHLDCVAAVVVTASHNPPQDNGYKVYLGDGSQIVPPADAEIAARIDAVASGSLADIARARSYRVIGGELVDAYLARLTDLVPADAPRDLNWVYTPMHGVGLPIVDRAVAGCGFAPPQVVSEQAAADPDFPTVAFPNPEEPGAIDVALAEAQRIGADLVVANDPDADRCAVAIPVGDGRGVRGDWRMLRGDELGALLGDDALRRGIQGTYACSIVSSSLLSAMAAAYRQPFTYTLTGFKWIGRVPGLAFGYEEAIGYCVDAAVVPDKDGISALITVLTLATQLKAEGRTLADRLDEIATTYGVHDTDQLSVRVDDLSLITQAMARLRAQPPTHLLGAPVTVLDLATGGDLPPTDGVLITNDQVKVVVRPSGTEPKLKCYLEVRLAARAGSSGSDPDSDPGSGPGFLTQDRATARELLAQVRTEMAAALGL